MLTAGNVFLFIPGMSSLKNIIINNDSINNDVLSKITNKGKRMSENITHGRKFGLILVTDSLAIRDHLGFKLINSTSNCNSTLARVSVDVIIDTLVKESGNRVSIIDASFQTGNTFSIENTKNDSVNNF